MRIDIMTEVMALKGGKVYHPLYPKRFEKDYYRVALCGVTTPLDREIVDQPPKGRRLCKHCKSYMLREERNK